MFPILDYVMAVLVTAIHVFMVEKKGVDDRNKYGHDDRQGRSVGADTSRVSSGAVAGCVMAGREGCERVRT
jgi:hypothetical protein